MHSETKSGLFAVAAMSPNPSKPPQYFVGYGQDTGIVWGTRWSRDIAAALKMPRDEAVTEARLLARSYPTRDVLPVEAR